MALCFEPTKAQSNLQYYNLYSTIDLSSFINIALCCGESRQKRKYDSSRNLKLAASRISIFLLSILSNISAAFVLLVKSFKSIKLELELYDFIFLNVLKTARAFYIGRE